jgi:hypothetical protein
MQIASPRGKLIEVLYRKACALRSFKTTIDRYLEFQDGAAIHKFTAANRDKGVSLIAHLIDMPSPTTSWLPAHITVRIRTRGTAYRTLWDDVANDDTAIDMVLAKAKEALNYKPMDPTLLPEPWRFNEQTFEIIQSKRVNQTRVRVHSQIAIAEVLKVVVVGYDGVLSDDNIANPNMDCWYLVDCVGHMGATFNIITDGEVFYPTNRVTSSTQTVRIVQSGPNKQTVDLKDVGPLDKDLINKAINEWVQQTCL